MTYKEIIRKPNNKTGYVAHHLHIICVCVLKLFLTLAINGKNCLCRDIIVYKIYPFNHKYCDIRNPNLKTILALLLIEVISYLNMNNILIILSTKVYNFPECGKRMKSINRLTRYINKCRVSRSFLYLCSPNKICQY